MEYTIERLKNCIKCNDYRGFDSIDKDMIPILIELNEKGWKTSYCCSGHIEEIERSGYWNAYISFSNKLKKVPDIILFKEKTRKESKNGMYNKFEKGSNSFYWYGSNNKKMSIKEKEQERKQFINNLFNRVKELPEYEYRNN